MFYFILIADSFNRSQTSPILSSFLVLTVRVSEGITYSEAKIYRETVKIALLIDLVFKNLQEHAEKRQHLYLKTVLDTINEYFLPDQLDH